MLVKSISPKRKIIGGLPAKWCKKAKGFHNDIFAGETGDGGNLSYNWEIDQILAFPSWELNIHPSEKWLWKRAIHGPWSSISASAHPKDHGGIWVRGKTNFIWGKKWATNWIYGLKYTVLIDLFKQFSGTKYDPLLGVSKVGTSDQGRLQTSATPHCYLSVAYFWELWLKARLTCLARI